MTGIEHFRAHFPELFSECHDLNCFCPDGWVKIVEWACERLQTVAPGSRVVCVKQKFGGLRMYVEGGSPAYRAIVLDAETQAVSVCENCGATGPTVSRRRTDGRHWISNECADCRDDWVRSRHATERDA